MDHSHHAHMAMTLLADVDPLAEAGFLAIFSFSLLASLHCALMCAPLVCALLTRQKAATRGVVALYNFGRFISYVGAGTALGACGGAVLGLSQAAGYVLAAGLALVLGFAGYRTLRPASNSTAARLAQRIAYPATKAFRRLPEPAAAFGLGLITVVFPCMTLFPVLALAAASGSALKGAAMLAAFQAGTLAVMVIAPLVPSRLARFHTPVVPRRLAALFLLIATAATVYRLIH